MEIIKRLLNDVLLFRAASKCDEVSSTSISTYRNLQALGMAAHFVQDNHSKSAAHVVRGLQIVSITARDKP